MGDSSIPQADTRGWKCPAWFDQGRDSGDRGLAIHSDPQPVLGGESHFDIPAGVDWLICNATSIVWRIVGRSGVGLTAIRNCRA